MKYESPFRTVRLIIRVHNFRVWDFPAKGQCIVNLNAISITRCLIRDGLRIPIYFCLLQSVDPDHIKIKWVVGKPMELVYSELLTKAVSVFTLIGCDCQAETVTSGSIQNHLIIRLYPLTMIIITLFFHNFKYCPNFWGISSSHRSQLRMYTLNVYWLYRFIVRTLVTQMTAPIPLQFKDTIWCNTTLAYSPMELSTREWKLLRTWQKCRNFQKPHGWAAQRHFDSILIGLAQVWRNNKINRF